MKIKKIVAFILLLFIILGNSLSFAETSVDFPVYSDASILIDASSRKSSL